MDIYLTNLTNSDRLRFPMLPTEISIKIANQFANYTILSIGEVRLPSGTSLDSISWNGILPGQKRVGAGAPFIFDWQDPKAIYRWITANVAYDDDHYDPLAKLSPDSSTPYGPLHSGKGICIGFAVTFQLLLDMAGVECVTIVGSSFSNGEDHAWNMVRLNGRWYCADTTWDKARDEANWAYFNCTSQWMADTDHQWDYANTPEATAADGGRG